MSPRAERAIKAVTALADGTLERVRDFIGTLNTTNWLIVTGTGMAALTGLVYLASILLKIQPEAVTFAAWLAFVTGWMTNGVRQFKIKRESHITGGPQDTAAPPPGGST